MSRGRYFSAVSLLLLVGFLGGAAADRDELRSQFRRAHPGVELVERDGVAVRAYGPPFSYGASPQDSALEFLEPYGPLVGTSLDGLGAGGSADLVESCCVQPVMYDERASDYRFYLVRYGQQRGGIPVFRADIRLLVRNDPDFPLVWMCSSLCDLGAFVPEPNPPPFDVAVQVNTGMQRFTPPRRVIYAGVQGKHATPCLAYALIGTRGSVEAGDYECRLYLADTRTGRIVYEEDQILYEDVLGNVSGWTTPPPKADICADELLVPLTDLQVCVQGDACVYTGADGGFVIPNGGSAPVTVTSAMTGRYFKFYDYAQPSHESETLTQTITPPGPADFVHNAANQEYTRAQVNGYVQANVVRDFALAYNPAYPVIGSQIEFPVNVNINASCNAYYDGSSINFYRASGGCPNTAFSNVVHHEYGHHLIRVAGNEGGSQYHEGMADTIALLIADDPVAGYGFFGDCGHGIRTADNDLQYPCEGEGHDCGQLISGCVWATRNELVLTHPSEYREILASLTINSILLHPNPTITPQITVDFLTLDDDDGNINNGTPHFGEICRGFGAHGMNCPDDCNGNGVLDEIDIASGTSLDCNSNGVPDECELALHDCNQNGVLDACDIASGTSADCNGDGHPDECAVMFDYGWTCTVGGYDEDGGYGIAMDSVGDIVVRGSFSGEVDFDPGPGVDIHVAIGTGFFVSKLHGDGSYAWTRTFSGGGLNGWGSTAMDQAVDSQNSILLVGYFSGLFDFDPGSGEDWHSSSAPMDVFVTKLYADGSYAWTRTLGSPSHDCATSVVVDAYDDVWVVGYFQDTADFDPGPGLDERTSNGAEDVFLTRYHADGSYVGTWTWGGGSVDQPRSMALDNSGHLVVGGYFSGTVDFDPTGGSDAHHSNGGYDAFVTRIGIDGTYAWTRTWGARLGADKVGEVASDAAGNVLAGGVFNGEADFDPGEGVDLHISQGNSDRFISKLWADGSFAWARTWGDPNYDDSFPSPDMAFDRNGDIWIGGSFFHTVDFDPGPGVDERTSRGASDIYLTRYRADGTYAWTLAWGGADVDGIGDVGVTPTGDVLLTGLFRQRVDLDPGPGEDWHQSLCGHNCYSDIFISRFTYDALLYADCNGNGVFDVCDIDAGTCSDVNHDRIPDQCESLADLDCDGFVTFDDVAPFVLALSDPVAYAAAYPNCHVEHADCNGDGHENFADIDPFVEVLAR